MKIVFDENAIRDLESIYLWIAEESEKAARSVDQRLRDAISHLAVFPLSGRRGIQGARELLVSQLPYVVVYEVDYERGQIVISQIVHMARDRSGPP